MCIVGSRPCCSTSRSNGEGAGIPGGACGRTVPAMTDGREDAPMAPVPVLIVDDQIPFRRAARMVLTVTPGFEVVGEAMTGEDAVDQYEVLDPALVLMDINLPGISGIEATRRITAAHPDAIVVLLSTYRADDLPADAESCGAVEYVNKEQFESAVVLDLWERHRPSRGSAPGSS